MPNYTGFSVRGEIITYSCRICFSGSKHTAKRSLRDELNYNYRPLFVF